MRIIRDNIVARRAILHLHIGRRPSELIGRGFRKLMKITLTSRTAVRMLGNCRIFCPVARGDSNYLCHTELTNGRVQKTRRGSWMVVVVVVVDR